MKSTSSPSWIDRLLGLAPMPVPPHAFALTAEGLAYAGFAREARGGFTLRDLRVWPLPADTFQPGLLGGPAREHRPLEERIASALSELPKNLKEASLVLPDAWVRTTFVEANELPRNSTERDEVLRWKLKRLVPFRVDDLRVSGVEVTPLPAQEGSEEPRRVMIGFGLEVLLSQLETAFELAGVRLGRIVNEGLAAFSSLARDLAGPGELVAMVLAEEDSYSLVFARDGEPLLQRYKAFSEGLPDEARGSFVGRDLLLTRNFLVEHFANTPLARVVLAASDEQYPAWSAWLGEALGHPAEPLEVGHLVPLRSALSRATPPLRQLAPLVGAVAQEVE